MKEGFIRVASMTPDIKVADCQYNADQIIALLTQAAQDSVSVAVFPEMCLTGYTCHDLFLQEILLQEAAGQLIRIMEASTQLKPVLAFIGLPLVHNSKLYNVAAAVYRGRILGFVPKKYLPNYGEFYERRQFTPGNDSCEQIAFHGMQVPFGSHLLFSCNQMPELKIGAEICEDLWTPQPPSISHALHGATVLVNCSASNETIGKDRYRRDLVKGQSARLVSAYIYSSAGEGESTQDIVFGGHNLIAENGTILAEAEKFQNQSIYAEIDLDRLRAERIRMSTFETAVPGSLDDYTEVHFDMEQPQLQLQRKYDRFPFVPDDRTERDLRCEEILAIQTMGLKKRLQHTHCRCAVIGISGGLDSTLALLVTVRAFDALQLDRSGILCVTMPCFGTTDRTYQNAVTLTARLGATLREIDIRASVRQHFQDIGQDENIHDVTYENGQARERTQVLMDLANQQGGMVIGTGDMSELALGWATYNGDHMSMYGVNASVPKTLVRHLVQYFADTCKDQQLSEVLTDILHTPVSPELLPPSGDGTISQKTEDLVGPYELHDFFLYHMLRFGVRPKKLFALACHAFEGVYEPAVIRKWLTVFIRRFFSQQFKRSCLPDGPKVGSVAVSPRGDLRMPSDASAALWLRELEETETERKD